MNRVGFFFNGLPPLGADSFDLYTEPQPKPLLTRVARMQVGSRWITVIDRKWLFGDSSKCKLCPTCTAFGSECLLMIGALVSDDEAPLYRTEKQPDQSD